VSVSSDKTVQVFDFKEEKLLFKSEKEHKGTISGVSWLSDDTFATSSMDKTVRIWDCVTQKTKAILLVAKKPTLFD